MIDREYDHAVESIESKIYVSFFLLRSLIGTSKKNHNAQDLGLTQNVFAVIHLKITRINTLVKNLAQTVSLKIVHANSLSLFLLDHNNAECIG